VPSTILSILLDLAIKYECLNATGQCLSEILKQTNVLPPVGRGACVCAFSKTDVKERSRLSNRCLLRCAKQISSRLSKTTSLAGKPNRADGYYDL